MSKFSDAVDDDDLAAQVESVRKRRARFEGLIDINHELLSDLNNALEFAKEDAVPRLTKLMERLATEIEDYRRYLTRTDSYEAKTDGSSKQ